MSCADTLCGVTVLARDAFWLPCLTGEVAFIGCTQ
jgi:hypothetical protein